MDYCMKTSEGLTEDFSNARVVYLTTMSKSGKMSSRPMTNFNRDPYNVVYFPSFKNTKKVSEIEANDRVFITFPCSKKDEFCEIEGRAEVVEGDLVEEKWQWWYLFWHPEMSAYFWDSSKGEHPDRVIINVYPESVKKAKRGEIHLGEGPYMSKVLSDIRREGRST